MIAANEWMARFLNGQTPTGGEMFYGSVDLIQIIQEDALEAAAEIAYDGGESGIHEHIAKEVRALKPKARRESHGRPVFTEAEIKERGWPYGPESEL